MSAMGSSRTAVFSLLLGISSCRPAAAPCDATCELEKKAAAGCERGEARGCYDSRQYERACELGLRDGCVAGVGALYGYTDHPREDEIPKIVALLARACDLGDLRACARAGKLSRHNNPVRAREWLSRACDRALTLPANDATPALDAESERKDALRACVFLARLLEHGAGGSEDPQRAFGLARAGCDRRDGSACELLGWYAYAGVGAPRNSATATEHFGAACTLGMTTGCSLRDLLTGKARLAQGPFVIVELESFAHAASVRHHSVSLPPPGSHATLHSIFSVSGAINAVAWTTFLSGHVAEATERRLTLETDDTIKVHFGGDPDELLVLAWPPPDASLSDADCASRPQCKKSGVCRAGGGYCVFGPASGCAASDSCRYTGRCGASETDCIATPEGCRRASACEWRGDCVAVGSRCRPASAEDCSRSTGCLDYGRCELREGACVPTESSCARSRACREQGRCGLVKGQCEG